MGNGFTMLLPFSKVKVKVTIGVVHTVINYYKTSGYIVYLLVNSRLKIMVYLQMLYSCDYYTLTLLHINLYF